MTHDIKRLLWDEDGVATVEYALLLSVVVISSVGAWQVLGDTIGNLIQESTTQIATGGN